VAEEYCWAITQAAGWGYAAADQVPFMSESLFQLEWLVYTYIFDHVYYQLRLAPDFPVHNCGFNRG
jgi:hypothetical protein